MRTDERKELSELAKKLYDSVWDGNNPIPFAFMRDKGRLVIVSDFGIPSDKILDLLGNAFVTNYLSDPRLNSCRFNLPPKPEDVGVSFAEEPK
jgi:hypothetical protein